MSFVGASSWRPGRAPAMWSGPRDQADGRTEGPSETPFEHRAAAGVSNLGGGFISNVFAPSLAGAYYRNRLLIDKV